MVNEVWAGVKDADQVLVVLEEMVPHQL